MGTQSASTSNHSREGVAADRRNSVRRRDSRAMAFVAVWKSVPHGCKLGKQPGSWLSKHIVDLGGSVAGWLFNHSAGFPRGSASCIGAERTPYPAVSVDLFLPQHSSAGRSSRFVLY